MTSVLQVAHLPWLLPVHTVQGITWAKLIHIVLNGTQMCHSCKKLLDQNCQWKSSYTNNFSPPKKGYTAGSALMGGVTKELSGA